MKKATYLLILILLSIEVFDIEPIGSFFNKNSGIYYLSSLLIWMYYGFIKYRNKGSNRLRQPKYYHNVMWIGLGIILSFIPAYLYQNQTFLQSIVTYRTQLFWLIIPLLIIIRPTEKDIVKAVTIFAVFFFIISFAKTYLSQAYFYTYEGDADIIYNIQRGLDQRRKIALAGGGFQLLIIPLYYYCNLLSQSIKLKNLLLIIFFLVVIFLAQNRSTLFVAMLIVAYSIFKLRSNHKFIMTVLLILALSTILYLGYDSLNFLFNSTLQELNNQDYNRNKAYLYFFNNSYNNWLTIFLGQGFLSRNSTRLMEDLMAMGIYNSDAGFIGFWNQYGLLPIIAFFSATIGALRKKNIPFYVKAFAIHILFCSITISYFGNPSSILWYAFFYYMYIFNLEYNDNGQLIKYDYTK